MSILPKVINMLKQPLSKSQWQFYRNRTKNPKVCMGPGKTSKSQSNLEKDKQSGDNACPNFKLYYKTMVIKTVQCWQKNRDTDQWNR